MVTKVTDRSVTEKSEVKKVSLVRMALFGSVLAVEYHMHFDSETTKNLVS